MGSEIDEVRPRNCVTGFQMTQNLLRAEQIAEEFNRNLKLIVSSGIGTTFLPYRINCPPEIVLLRFR